MTRLGSLGPSFWIATGVLLVLATLASAAWVAPQRRKHDDDKIRIAFLGNSMLYFNDCPRILEQMLRTLCQKVYQDSCLRGGSTLVSLFNKGNGMQVKFASQAALKTIDGNERKIHDIGAPTVQALLDVKSADEAWDFVVLNDHTQSPARDTTRFASLQVLRDRYLPLLQKSPGVVVTLLQTPAYKFKNLRHTEDLGDFDSFTDRLASGYARYQQVLQREGMDCRVAPVGEAFRWLHHHHKDLWGKLYDQRDDFHPSPHGTWLEACVLYCTITQQAPPTYNASWWNACRRMQPPHQQAMPLPNALEAEELRQVACRVCNVAVDSEARDTRNATSRL